MLGIGRNHRHTPGTQGQLPVFYFLGMLPRQGIPDLKVIMPMPRRPLSSIYQLHGDPEIAQAFVLRSGPQQYRIVDRRNIVRQNSTPFF